MALEIDIQEAAPGLMVIRLAGRLVLGAESQRLETLFLEKLAQGYRKFVFDVSGLTHIDSTGIGRFIFFLNKLMPLGGQMRLVGAQGAVRDGFRVTRLDTVFKFAPTLAEAQQQLA